MIFIPSSRSVLRQSVLAALSLMLAGCAVDSALRDSSSLRQQGDLEGALTRVESARKLDPDDLQLRAEQRQLLEQYAPQTLQRAQQALQAGNEAGAVAQLQSLARHDPGNLSAEQGLRRIELRATHRAWLAQAQSMAQQNPAAALDWLSKILAEEPDWREAISLRDQLLRQTADASLSPPLPAALKKPVALSFRNQSLMTIFDVISDMTGINFVIDREVPPGLTGTIRTKHASAWEAINLLLATNHLAKKMLNENTLLIYPARADKVREYQDLGVRTFYLSNAEPKQVLATLKQVLKPRELAIDERLNAVIMRDDPAVLSAAERIVQSLDLPQSEVTLDVEVLEVSSSLARDLGIAYPEKGIGVGFIGKDGAMTGLIDAKSLGDLSGSTLGLDFGSPAAKLNLYQKNNQVRTLANPKIRVKNHEKAQIVIGEKIPVVNTTTGSSGNFAGESISYQDVGLTLKVEPSISLGSEITVNVSLVVSDILNNEKTKNGSTAYTLGNRSAETVLSTRDNVTQVLGGLIKRGGTESRAGLPYVSQIPLLDSLLGTHQTAQGDSEIILLITPHIMRQFVAPPSAITRFQMGPEARVGDPLELREGAGNISVSAGQVPVTSPASSGATPPPPPPAALPARALPPPGAGNGA